MILDELADHRAMPLIKRKAALRRTLAGSTRVRCVEHFEGACTELWAVANEFQLEGVVTKDAASAYSAGRTTRWQKIKTAVGAERERRRRLP